jgi:hypothetical protein
MKKVAYLFGAGITQAELDFVGSGIKVLAAQLIDGIEKRLNLSSNIIKNLISNDLFIRDVDIEQLISLFESTGTTKDTKAACFLKNSYMIEISTRLAKMDINNSKFQPLLMLALFEMHHHYGPALEEEMTGILTLNYDDFAERALQSVYHAFGCGFKIAQSHTYNFKDEPILLKLHGSFNWSNDFPPSIHSVHSKNSEQCLWIPPGVDKKKEKYPFNILWGKAKEVLDCDVLRVIGCSLSRNDWQLISLLNSTMRSHHFIIECIDYDNVGQDKSDKYPYLDIISILKIDGFRKYLDGETENVELFDSTHPNRANCFLEWIKFRKSILIQQTINFSTSQYITSV